MNWSNAGMHNTFMRTGETRKVRQIPTQEETESQNQFGRYMHYVKELDGVQTPEGQED